MGTKMAPSYATLVLGYLETHLYEKVSKDMGVEVGTFVLGHWKRFLDDCFIDWPYGELKLTQLHGTLNSLNTDIQLNYSGK